MLERNSLLAAAVTQILQDFDSARRWRMEDGSSDRLVLERNSLLAAAVTQILQDFDSASWQGKLITAEASGTQQQIVMTEDETFDVDVDVVESIG